MSSRSPLLRLVRSALVAASAALLLWAVPSAAADHGLRPPLTGTTWQLRQIQVAPGDVLQVPRGYFAELRVGRSTFTFLTECTRGRGDFQRSGETVNVSGVQTTRLSCPEGSPEIEREIVSRLEGRGTWQIRGRLLTLRRDDSALVFRAVAR